MTVYGLDLGHATVVEAEHWLASLPPVPGLVACTHLVYDGRPRVVVTLDGPASLVPADHPVPADHRLPADCRGAAGDACVTAVRDHVEGRSGRAVIFPGVDELVGIVTVRELLAGSAIDRIQIIGGACEVVDTQLIDTRNFVRPQWLSGKLTLMATPAPGGRIAPFEVPNPTPCCGGAH